MFSDIIFITPRLHSPDLRVVWNKWTREHTVLRTQGGLGAGSVSRNNVPTQATLHWVYLYQFNCQKWSCQYR